MEKKRARAFLRGIQKLYVGFQRERAGSDDDISNWPISSQPPAYFGIWTNQNEDRDRGSLAALDWRGLHQQCKGSSFGPELVINKRI